MNKAKQLFIVGHSGAGKGVVAQAVAKQLGWQFINADVLGAATTIGRRVSEIFGSDGEQRFNQLLTDILRHQLTQENIVVATDENIVCDKVARELLAAAFAVNITVSASTQVERMGDSRPLLPVENYKTLLEALHDAKDAWFAEVAKNK